MSTKVIGKLDNWGDADLGGSDFMQLEEGNNPIRMVTSPYQFYIHWTKDSTGANRKIHCVVDDCPICQQGERAVARWYVGVINRKVDKLKLAILEIGPQIFKQILGLAKKEKWGDPRKYDVDIERQPKGSQPLYIVSPEPKEGLNDEEKAAVREFLAKVDLGKMSLAPTADEVREKIGLSSPKKAVVSAVNNDFEDTTIPAVESSSDDDDFDFDK